MNLKKLWNIVFGVTCAAVIICLAVSITVWFRPIYYFDIDYLEISQNSGYSEEICRENYDILIDYNQLGGPDTLQFTDFYMSETGRIHFEEVKDIFMAMQYAAIAGIAAIITKIICNKRHGTSGENFLWLRVAVISAVSVAAVVLAAVAINWEWAFETIHSIFFDNDYWIFNAKTDPIIKILPDTFFMHCGIIIAVLVIITMIIFEAAYRICRRKVREKGQDSNGTAQL